MLSQLYFLAVLIVYTEGASDSDMRQLLDSLLNSTQYSSRVRPIKDTGNVLTVSVHINVMFSYIIIKLAFSRLSVGTFN